MTDAPGGSGGASALSVLGFSAAEEELYRVLLRSSGTSVDSVAELLGESPAALKDDLTRFVAAGLVELGGDGTVLARPPEQAIGRLVAEETRRVQSTTEQLKAVRDLLPSLQADHLASRAPRGEPVTIEVVDGGDVVGLMRSLTATSTGDLLWLRPGPWSLPVGPEIDEWVKQEIRGGRRSRAIYPARVLEQAPEVVRSRAEAGESVRILAAVPSRVAIFGDAAALVPEQWGVGGDRRLVVRQHSLIVPLQQLFESLWERAMAVPGLDGEADRGGRLGDRRLLLDQLAGGAKDEQIARALGLSLRTVRRRVADILDELGAASRFQAGVEAVRRGWI